MSIFNNGDICRHICTYLSFEDTCMFRRCNRDLHTYISGNFFYDRKTACLTDLHVSHINIMGFTMDVNYRRYLKKKGCRQICQDFYLSFICDSDVKIARYIMKTKSDKLYGKDHTRHMRKKDRELIDLSVKLSCPDQLGKLFREILRTKDDDLITWFETKYVGDQLEKLILENRPDYGYGPLIIDEPADIMWDRYGSQYRHLFLPRKDDVTGKLKYYDVIFALKKRLLPDRVIKQDVTNDVTNDVYMRFMFRHHGYVEEGDCFVKHD